MGIQTIGVLALGLGLASLSGTDETKKLLCANNLKMNWLQQLSLKSKGKGPSISTGARFWTDLEPHLAEEDRENLVCPLSGKKPGKGVTTYRGPVKTLAETGKDDAVGACSGHHADGSVTVLWRNGAVEILPKGDPKLKQALATTAD